MSKDRTMSLQALIKYAIAGRSNKKAVHHFFVVSKHKVNLLKKRGKDITGFKHSIDSYAIKHILINHGDNNTEKKRGLVAITLDRFYLIPSILKNPDEIKIVKRNNKIFFVYKKQYKDEIIYVEEVLMGRKELATKTMYIKKTRKK